MDIHKPKPWHGLREFLKEYVIIVIGVLTALGAEQAVEWWRWQARVEAAEGLIRRDLSYARVIAEERMAAAPCLDRRLAMLEDRLLASGATWTPLPPMIHPTVGPTVYETPFRTWPTEGWRSLSADGTVGHLRRAREIALASTFAQIGEMGVTQGLSEAEIGEFNLLSRPIDLDRGQRLAFARLIERERWRVKTMESGAGQIHKRISKLVEVEKLPGDVIANSGTLRACRALGLLAPPASGGPGT